MSLKKLGRYDIVKPLGKGAMGLVYEAHDPNLDRRVAIKTIRVDQLSPELAAEYESRFRAEARAGGRLQHPNIIGVYDSGRDSGLAYMVMELVRGGDLKQQLDQGARLGFDRSFALMRELLSALSFAHEQGIIHRDIKPANVMLDSNGRVKLGDFGVARMTQSGDATRTQGSMVGTLKYMSPEQVQGLHVDSRTDLFAAGVVLYQLLTGSKPFDGANDFAIMQAIAQHDPAPPSSLNPSLPTSIDAVIAKALAKERDARYPSARDFMLGLRAVVAQAGGAAATMRPALAVAAAPAAAHAGTEERGEASTTASTGGTNTRLPPVSADPSATSPSALAQEMELLYWKDIQESSDPVDFQGFLQQFPAGVYAVLAARRLRRLARSLSDGTGSQSVLGTSPFGSAGSTGSGEPMSIGPEADAAPLAQEEAMPRDAEEAPGPNAAATGEGAPAEATGGGAAAGEARRLAAARAAEEEARWQEDLRREALREEALGRRTGPESSSFIDISTAPTPLAAVAPPVGGGRKVAARRFPARAAAALALLALLAGAAWWAFGSRRALPTPPAAVSPAAVASAAPAPLPASAPSSAATAALAASASATAEATTALAIAMPAPWLSLADSVVQIEAAADPSIGVTARSASSTLVAGRDPLRLSVTSSQSGYVYVFGSAADDDRLELLQPVGLGGRSPIKADATTVFRLGRSNNLTTPGPWHLLVLVSKQARNLAAAGWQARGAGFSRHFGPKEALQASPWPGPVCAPGVDPCSESYGTQEVELIVLPAPAAQNSAHGSAPAAALPSSSAELPKSR